MRTGDGVEHVGHVAKAAANLEYFGLERLVLGEGEKLPGQLGGALYRLRDRIDVPAAPILGQVPPAKEVHGGADDGEQVVEIVCHAARQLEDRLHLPRLPKRLICDRALVTVRPLGLGPGHHLPGHWLADALLGLRAKGDGDRASGLSASARYGRAGRGIACRPIW